MAEVSEEEEVWRREEEQLKLAYHQVWGPKTHHLVSGGLELVLETAKTPNMTPKMFLLRRHAQDSTIGIPDIGNDGTDNHTHALLVTLTKCLPCMHLR